MASKKPGKRALNCVFLMINADRPTLAEYEAAREAGFIDITVAGLQAHLKDQHPDLIRPTVGEAAR